MRRGLRRQELREVEKQFRQEVEKAIATALAGGLDGDRVANNLRAFASEVGRKWNVELDRRNAERIKELAAK
jgi:hypothetical protein